MKNDVDVKINNKIVSTSPFWERGTHQVPAPYFYIVSIFSILMPNLCQYRNENDLRRWKINDKSSEYIFLSEGEESTKHSLPNSILL